MIANECRMHTDGIGVYVFLKVKNGLLGKIMVLIACAMFVPVIILGVVEGIPMLALVTLLVEFLLVRYALWNFFGRENLIINTKSVTWQHEYGFYKTQHHTRPIQKRLIIERTIIDDEAEVKQFTLNLISYNDHDIPVYIHQIAISMSEPDAKQLDQYMEQLYLDKMADDRFLPHINLN